MASHQLIEAYLADLDGKLPPATIEELADGLHETWEQHPRLGMNPDHAAQQAIAEFGTPQKVNDAFVANAHGRRTARLLLATGPGSRNLLGRQPHRRSRLAQFPVFDPRNVRVDMLSRRGHRRLACGGAKGVVTVCALAVIEGAAWLAARLWPEPYDGPELAPVIGLIAAMVCLVAVKAEARLRKATVFWLLVLEGALPRDLQRFLHAAHRAGLLDQTREGYRFAHRQLRHHFLGGALGHTGSIS